MYICGQDVCGSRVYVWAKTCVGHVYMCGQRRVWVTCIFVGKDVCESRVYVWARRVWVICICVGKDVCGSHVYLWTRRVVGHMYICGQDL